MAVVGLCTVAALALHPDLELACGGHSRAGRESDLAGGDLSPDVLAVNSVNAFHCAVFDHGGSALSSLLRGLERELNGAAQLVLDIVEDVGGGEHHSGMGIVAAGVHNAVNGGLVGQIVLLGDRKSVHVAADEDGLAGLAALYGGQYAGLKTTLYVRHAYLIKFGLDELAGFIFLGAEFGVHVEVSAGLDDVVAVLLSSFLDVHNMPFLFRRVRGVIADE